MTPAVDIKGCEGMLIIVDVTPVIWEVDVLVIEVCSDKSSKLDITSLVLETGVVGREGTNRGTSANPSLVETTGSKGTDVVWGVDWGTDVITPGSVLLTDETVFGWRTGIRWRYPYPISHPILPSPPHSRFGTRETYKSHDNHMIRKNI